MIPQKRNMVISISLFKYIRLIQNTVSTIRARFEIDDNGSLEDRRSGIQIYDLFNQANEGTTITDAHIMCPTLFLKRPIIVLLLRITPLIKQIRLI